MTFVSRVLLSKTLAHGVGVHFPYTAEKHAAANMAGTYEAFLFVVGRDAVAPQLFRAQCVRG